VKGALTDRRNRGGRFGRIVAVWLWGVDYFDRRCGDLGVDGFGRASDYCGTVCPKKSWGGTCSDEENPGSDRGTNGR